MAPRVHTILQRKQVEAALPLCRARPEEPQDRLEMNHFLHNLFEDESAARDLQRSLSRRGRRQDRSRAELRERIEELEGDVGYLSLILASVLCKLDERGVLDPRELGAIMKELDLIDGKQDGQLDTDVLRDVTNEAMSDPPVQSEGDQAQGR